MTVGNRWTDSWTVVLCYPDGTMHQTNFLLSKQASRVLGSDRAKRDAEDFVVDFQDVARVLYFGPTCRMSKHLKQDIAEDRHCEALGENQKRA